MALIIVAGESGQHAAVVYEAAVLSGMSVLGFATVRNTEPPSMFDCPWLGNIGDVATSQIAKGNEFIVACGSNKQRRQQSATLSSLGATLRSIYHPAAIVSPSAQIGAGSAILAGAIVGPRTIVGVSTIINHAASIDHDCKIGDFTNISPGARFAGCVQAGVGVFVGLNASILQGIKLGENSVVGAGAVVIRDVLSGKTVVGVPARPLR
ncbi:NeuD/PglB/VioB family sugar acetyltransferase [Sphingomonas sp. BAUL-RG-20F-R05-02]|uniref:NeuD/PglB/VioB family sugar acetyltransferase n=1 Tax=Sphingomonas sp. BAUL-RG-20F-R05-02 TaxID=2914830 RepID=UPI001F5A9465|nr:NeuD/PglB/VioB family sugar acetyltransferase [Sphingomonas sp. BAUL-RG-20F-R05-02]